MRKKRVRVRKNQGVCDNAFWQDGYRQGVVDTTRSMQKEIDRLVLLTKGLQTEVDRVNGRLGHLLHKTKHKEHRTIINSNRKGSNRKDEAGASVALGNRKKRRRRTRTAEAVDAQSTNKGN